ncbi:MAG TPA: hypothetical protein VMC42_06455 [Methanoregulaceae archaeon]|nr:hypothetical protein [Methanoregulaceae archaeon]
MNDSTRRTVLFVIVVIAGSVLVIFDIPAIVMIVGIIALAVLVLVINGSIHFPKISLKKRPAPKTKPVVEPAAAGTANRKPKKSWFSIGNPAADKISRPGPKSGQKAGTGTAHDFFSSMTRAFSVLAADISRAGKSGRSKEQKKKKIDEMLDGSITGNVSDIRSLKDANPEMIPVSRKTIDDPFTTLVKEPINTELLDSAKSEVDISSLSDINLDEDVGTPSIGDDISHLDVSLDVEEEKITIDEETDDEVANILAAHQEELGPGDAGDKSPIASDMSNLEEFDIGSIDLDEELDLGDDLPEPEKTEASPGPGKTNVPKEPEKVAAAQPVEKPRKMEDSMVAFSTGKGEDDDLMSSLKSEATKTKKESHASLVRDLKGINVPVQDLEKELEGFLTMNKTKNNKAGER